MSVLQKQDGGYLDLARWMASANCTSTRLLGRSSDALLPRRKGADDSRQKITSNQDNRVD